MPRLRSPQGSIVNVDDEDAERLIADGFTAESDKKAPAKKAASSKSDT